ncbi:DUF924 domain-containing protein [Uruburuella testudinis]|uniref:DUF924 domain-containing protein n=1 Tax=Uruburuella testudinis TaxID=1282863 RepID=A0ABY4DT79_9NEIS|nr:DUF924 family protein [Uruburuella testudinis]UOO82250.1 DUF924 domain-containing protein [Uruburuella testudinis]
MHSQTILDFWFAEETRPHWFAKSNTFDRLIETRFGEVLKQAAAGGLAHWRTTPEGRLAEIIVLDQFSRNVYRDTPQAFAQDGMALVLAQEAVAQPGFANMPAAQRKFVLMPYMHSESAQIHAQAEPLFAALDDPLTQDFENRHRAIIERFGRYPHRNAILGRTDSAEEAAFLQQEDSSF